MKWVRFYFFNTDIEMIHLIIMLLFRGRKKNSNNLHTHNGIDIARERDLCLSQVYGCCFMFC